MTLIAWDGRYVAADSQMTYGSTRASGEYKKIRKKGNTVYAFTGTAALFDPMIVWFEQGAKPEERPIFADDDGRSTLIVWRDGKCHSYKIETPYPCECFAPDAWGVASDHALGAMDSGTTAIKAVERAIEREIYLGGPVLWVDLQPKRRQLAAIDGGACA